MMLAALILQSTSSIPKLDEVYRRVGELPGVVIEAEMVRPSAVQMKFKIARGGVVWAKYPTSLMVTTLKETTTWMPDRREYATAPKEEGNPLPAGFDLLWPESDLPKLNGDPSKTMFSGKPAYRYPILMGPQAVDLFVDSKTRLPMGSIATAGGTTYEIRYKSVRPTSIRKETLLFSPPKGARLSTGGDPNAGLVHPETTLTNFRGKELNGSTITLDGLLRNKSGAVLNFWFSACTGCVEEMPALRALAKSLAANQIVFLGVNPIDNVSDATKTSKQQRLPYPTLTGQSASALAERLGVRAYPVTIVLDSRARVIDAFSGFQPDRLNQALKKLAR